MSDTRPEGLREAVGRVTTFLDRWGRIRQLPPDVIHSIGRAMDESQLLVSDLRAILAAHEAAPEPEAEVVEEWGVRYGDGEIDGEGDDAWDERTTRDHVAILRAEIADGRWEASEYEPMTILRRTRTVRPDVVTEWEEVTDE